MAIITRGISGGSGNGTSGTSGTSGSSGSSGSSGTGGAFISDEKLALELEMAFKSSSPTIQKQLGYDTTTGNLTLITIYAYDTTTASVTIVLFTKVLEYNSEGTLIKITITRIFDSATLVKDLTYDGNENLTIITSVHNPP